MNIIFMRHFHLCKSKNNIKIEYVDINMSIIFFTFAKDSHISVNKGFIN